MTLDPAEITGDWSATGGKQTMVSGSGNSIWPNPSREHRPGDLVTIKPGKPNGDFTWAECECGFYYFHLNPEYAEQWKTAHEARA